MKFSKPFRPASLRSLSLPLLTGAGVLAVSSAISALAAPNGPGPNAAEARFPISIAEMESRQAERFAAADSNGDGMLSRDELKAAQWSLHPSPGMGRQGPRGDGMRMPHPPMHPQMGTDGRPGAGPQQPPHMGMAPHPGMQPGMRPGREDAQTLAERDAKIFAALDSNGDGSLSADEFSHDKLAEAGRTVFADSLFERLDSNQDGLLSRSELPDPAARLKAMDADGDGSVTADEARAYRETRRAAHRAARAAGSQTPASGPADGT